VKKKELFEKLDEIHGKMEDLRINVKSALDEIRDIMDDFDELPDEDDIEDDDKDELEKVEGPDPRD
jgi:hypothetical protein